MCAMTDVQRYAAFTSDPDGGNPAGVVLDAGDLDDAAMQAIAAEVSYSETAFLRPRPDEPHAYDVRYFAPLREVPFCGHATIASGVALARRDGVGTFVLHTSVGPVEVETAMRGEAVWATLTSVEPRVVPADVALVGDVLTALRWADGDLHGSHPRALANAGAWHLVLVARTRERLADLHYDVDALRTVMEANDLTTIQLVWPDSHGAYQSRNPFPVGGVYEDPATGAAAAAFGAYLAHFGFVAPDAAFTIEQGVDLGRPSLLQVRLDGAGGRVRVSGKAVRL